MVSQASVCPHGGGGWVGVPPTGRWGGAVPHQANGGYCHLAYGGTLDGGTPHWDWMGYPPLIGTGCGYPPLRLDGGNPHQDWMGVSPIRRQSSRVSTCYAVGGMPLAFTQEDFLVSGRCPPKCANHVSPY